MTMFGQIFKEGKTGLFLIDAKYYRKIGNDHEPRKICSRKQDLEMVNEEFVRILKVSVQAPDIGPNDKIS